MEKQANARSQIEEKMIREEQTRLEHESHVVRMEQEELELIQKLQNTQLLQKAAYEDLENALQTNEMMGETSGNRPQTRGSTGKPGARPGQGLRR